MINFLLTDAAEISNVRADGVLTAEIDAKFVAAQMFPKFTFSRGEVFA